MIVRDAGTEYAAISRRQWSLWDMINFIFPKWHRLLSNLQPARMRPRARASREPRPFAATGTIRFDGIKLHDHHEASG